MKKQTWAVLLGAIVVTIIYFGYSVALSFDSSHYVWLAEMFTSNLDFANWQPVRSFIFPLGIYLLNVFFGKGQLGLLIGTYTFYIAMVIAAWYMYRNTIRKNETNVWIKTIIVFLFIILVMFNAIIFGFYHVLLTEFASVTIAIIMCYLSWNWMNFGFQEKKLTYVIYTIAFAILTICSWHLKQPYILTTIMPLVIATILSFIEDHSKKNIIQRLTTVFICIIALMISMIGWNTILKIKRVNIEASDSSDGLLGSNIVQGISVYRTDPNDENYLRENIEKDDRLTEEDREKILDILDHKSEYQGFLLLDRGTYMNPIGNRKVIYTKEKDISTSEGLGFVFDTLRSDPGALFESYLANYFAISDIYKVGVKIDYGNYYYITKEFHWDQDTEITYLGYATYRDTSNDLGVGTVYMPYAQDYLDSNRHIKCVNQYMVRTLLPAKVLFKVILVLLPWLFVLKVIGYFMTRKKYQGEYKRINELILILYSYAFIQIMMYVCLGSIMDRYALAPYAATIIAAILHGYTIIRRKKYKKESSNEKNLRNVQKDRK